MKKKNWIYVFLFFLLLAIIFIFKGKDVGSIKPVYFVYTFISYSLVIFLRTIKMKSIISVYTVIPLRETLSLTSSSQLMGAFIPGRAGELLISAYLKLKYALDITKVLPILFMDKIIELICVMLYTLVSVFFFNASLFSYFSDSFRGFGSTRQLYIVFGVTIFILLLLFIVNKYFKNKLRVILQNVTRSLVIPFKMPKLGLIIVGCSFIAIILEYLSLYFIFHAFNIDITLPKVIIAHSFGMVIGVISLIPGGQGSTEITMVSVLRLWGYSTREAVPSILASKLFTYAVLFLYAIPLLPYCLSVLKERRAQKKKVENG